MSGLGHPESKELFLRTAYGDAHPTPGVADAFEEISGACDGLPLALVSAAHVWRERQGKGWEGKYAFEEVNRAFSWWYESLADAAHMLSLGIFPYGHSINRKSLIRRWIAERLVSAEKDGDKRFHELVDQSIVEPVLITGSSDFKVKRFRLRRPVLEFIVRESVSKNMVKLLEGDEPLPREGGGPVLSIYQTTDTETSRGNIMSFSIFNKGVAFDDLQQCTYLRVLDLERCRGVDHSVVAGICKLSLLRYLSLRGSDVRQIPRETERLRYLETLDIRETVVNNLPVEALMLPRLVHLFGKFELPQELEDGRIRGKLERFFREESRLQTLAGLIVAKYNGYEHIVSHIRLLRKIKIWYQNHLLHYSTLLNELLIRNTALDSLSVDFGGSLMFPHISDIFGPCVLRSIKLRGRHWPLPAIIASSANYLSDVQLSSTVLPLTYLSTLQSLGRLLYLKLVAYEFVGDDTDTFTVKKDGFPSLERLCIEAPKLPHLRIVEGAMPALTSLHLLCPTTMPKHPGQMGEIDEPEATSETKLGKEWGIEYLRNLNDLVLPYTVGDEQLDFWKEKARSNMNRPKLGRYGLADRWSVRVQNGRQMERQGAKREVWQRLIPWIAKLAGKVRSCRQMERQGTKREVWQRLIPWIAKVKRQETRVQRWEGAAAVLQTDGASGCEVGARKVQSCRQMERQGAKRERRGEPDGDGRTGRRRAHGASGRSTGRRPAHGAAVTDERGGGGR
eukprot:XP_020407361.1 putative disease resistance protein At1g59780 [Zea mays]